MAHSLTGDRSEDVRASDDITFENLNLSGNVIEGLKKSGFSKPSPVQLEAIPVGRCGADLVIKSKSGTGKTLVFTVIALENVDLEIKGVQTIIIAPTREIAFQNAHVMHLVGSAMEGLHVQVFIGGLSLEGDQKKAKTCNIAVGTPGRLRQMIENKMLDCRYTRLLVLDEADKLMEESFMDDIVWIFTQLPVSKQVIAASATYPESLESVVTRFMKSPTFIQLEHTRPALLGLRQFVCRIPFHPMVQQQAKRKLDALLNILKNVEFDQCMIFTNLQTRAETLAAQLTTNGFSALSIVGSQNQTKRLQTLLQLRQHQCRILVATDLAARGIDSEHVNLVVQVDLPRDPATYLHRVGRAGRFGSAGSAVCLCSEGNELTEFQHVITRTGSLVKILPAEKLQTNQENQKSISSMEFYDLWEGLEVLEGSGISEVHDPKSLKSELETTVLQQMIAKNSTKTGRSSKSKKKEQLAKCAEIQQELPTAKQQILAEKNLTYTFADDNSQNSTTEVNQEEAESTWIEWYHTWVHYINRNKAQIEYDVYLESLQTCLNK